MPAPTSLPQQPKKRRKIDHGSSLVSEIKALEDELAAAVQANASLNKLADLVDLVVEKGGEPQEVSKGIYALYRMFTLIISAGKLSIQGDGPAKEVKAWLWERLHAYTDFLVVMLKDKEKILRTSSLQILFSLQKHLSTAQTAASTTPSSSSRPEFHLSHFRKIVSALLLCPSKTTGSKSSSSGKPSSSEIDADVLDTFYETWFSVYDDVRWFFLRECVGVLEKTPAGQVSTTKNLLSILERLETFPTDKEELNAWWVPELGAKPPKPKKMVSEDDDDDDDDEDALPGSPEDGDEDDDDWRKFFDEPTADDSTKRTQGPTARLHKLTVHQSLHSLASHKAVFTRAWLALLPRLSVVKDEDVRRALAIRALNVMHRGVLPHLTRAVLAMDWIAGCVDHGGSVGLLALNGLFTLMRDYNLDYPSFYTRLYAFLDRDVLHLKHRARFFRMTEVFLSSTHLPATLLASFIKRLARLSLSAPPAAIVMIIPFTYNILKRHPALMVMIHREAKVGFADPFNASEPNPLTTRALESSLWELYSHRTHYHSTVSTLCRVFTEAFTKPGYAMEDFLDHTYATLFETEVGRKIRREPALAVEGGVGRVEFFPAGPLVREGGEGEVQVDVVSELWVF